MKNLNRNLLFVLTGILGCLIALILARGARSVAITPCTIIIQDASRSAQRACDCIAGIGRQTFNSREAGNGASLTLMATGGPHSRNEPVRLAVFSIPKLTRVFEGRASFAQMQQQRLKMLEQACSQATEADATPLFQALKAAAESLNQFDLNGHGTHTLHVVSDAMETEEPAIVAALQGRSLAKLNLPATIDNHQIKVVFHAVAQTARRSTDKGSPAYRTGKHSAATADRLRATWKMMFTNPQLVSFEPFCSAPDSASPASLSH